ncbi:MAG: GNAT family N-acetyltransferase, partial [Actinobacteria bacterium]|nr:GNAT family N-acetyltransferase [Actinomycetota bacterium]
FRKSSPGLLLHLGLAEAAAATGMNHIDMGRGPKEYKELLKSRDLVVAEGQVLRRAPVATLHWARRAPVRRLRNVVTEHPSLFRVADQMLKRYGSARCLMQRPGRAGARRREQGHH